MPVSERPPPLHPYAVMAIGIAAVSTGAIFARAAQAHPVVIAAYRVGLAVLFLAPLVLWKARDELRRLGSHKLGLALLSGCFLALHFATWISSLNYTSVANSVLLVNTNPLWVALLNPFVTRETIGRRTRFSIMISVLGAIVIGAGDFHSDPRTLMGDGLAVVGSICAAAYLLLGRKLRGGLSLLAYVFICYGCAAVLLWIAVAVFQLPASGFPAATWGAFLGMALCSQLIGHSSYNWALRWVSASGVAISLLGEPIGASLLAYLLFGEALDAPKWIGGAMILSGIYLSATEKVRGR
ncbi:MAG: DMT family transporter [Desulfobacterales bacterium]